MAVIFDDEEECNFSLTDDDEKEWENVVFLLNSPMEKYLLWLSVDEIESRNTLQFRIEKDFVHYYSIFLNLADLPKKEGQVSSVFVFIRKSVEEALKNNTENKPYIVHVSGWENHALDEKQNYPFITQLNFERERIFQQLPFRLIFWSNEYVIKTIQRLAPDFWDWVTYDFYFHTRKKGNILLGLSKFDNLSNKLPFNADLLTNYLNEMEYFDKKKLKNEIQRRDYLALLQAVIDQYRRKGDFDNALKYALRNEQILIDYQEDEYLLADLYDVMGRVYRYLRREQEAVAYRLKGLAIIEKKLPLENLKVAIFCYEIGIDYYHLDDYSQSLFYLQKSALVGQKSIFDMERIMGIMRMIIGHGISIGRNSEIKPYITWYSQYFKGHGETIMFEQFLNGLSYKWEQIKKK